MLLSLQNPASPETSRGTRFKAWAVASTRAPVRYLVAARLDPVLGILGRVGGFRLGPPAPRLGFKARRRLLHAAIGHRLVLRGTGPQLAALRRDVAALDHSRRLTQPQNLREQVSQGRQMALAQIVRGGEIRPLHPRHRHEVEASLAGPRDPPRRRHAPAVACGSGAAIVAR